MYISSKVEIPLPIFSYHTDKFGGTEYMVKNVLEKIIPDLPKFKNYDCVVIPGVFDPSLKSSKERIMWIHNYPYEFSEEQLKILVDSANSKTTKHVIVVSETQKKNFIEKFNFPEEKIVVLPNAISPLKYSPTKFDSPKTVNLINTSAPERGLDLLLQATQLIEEDFTLRIFNRINPELDLTEKGKETLKDGRVMFYGSTPRATVYHYFEKSHIHSYPAVWSETFCLSQVEAMSAGCLNVYSTVENSALPEISNGFGIDAKLSYKDFEKDAKKYAEYLSKAIQQIKKGEWDPTAQIEYVNSTYTWEAAKEAWAKFHETL